MPRPAVAVSNVLHFAAIPEPGGQRQCCSRCGATLQEGPGIAAWPEGTSVVASHTGKGQQIAVFEGASPAQFTPCRPPRP